MKLLGRHEVRHGSEWKRLELYEGDLAAIPPQDAVDILIVSALPEVYVPTPGTLIGALCERGISVEAPLEGQGGGSTRFALLLAFEGDSARLPPGWLLAHHML